MDLKHTVANYFEVNCFDLEQFIIQEYGLTEESFSILSALETSNDTYQAYGIDGQLDEYEEGNLREFLNNEEGAWCGTVRYLMNDLCRKGRLMAGNYLVEISW